MILEQIGKSLNTTMLKISRQTSDNLLSSYGWGLDSNVACFTISCHRSFDKFTHGLNCKLLLQLVLDQYNDFEREHKN